jgi:hypothetical protein
MAVDGTYNITIKSPMGDRQATVVLKTDGAKLVGKERLLYDGTVKGNEVAWKTDITSPMRLTLKFKGKVEGDAFTGTASALLGSWSFSGTRA